jgi:hypothetical protein
MKEITPFSNVLLLFSREQTNIVVSNVVEIRKWILFPFFHFDHLLLNIPKPLRLRFLE